MTETLGVYTSAAGNSDAMVATGGRDSFNTDIMYMIPLLGVIIIIYSLSSNSEVCVCACITLLIVNIYIYIYIYIYI